VCCSVWLSDNVRVGVSVVGPVLSFGVCGVLVPTLWSGLWVSGVQNCMLLKISDRIVASYGFAVVR